MNQVGVGIVIATVGRTPLTVQGARRGVSDRGRVGQDLLHPRVGIEGLALHDADGGQRSHDLRVERADGLLLHHDR